MIKNTRKTTDARQRQRPAVKVSLKILGPALMVAGLALGSSGAQAQVAGLPTMDIGNNIMKGADSLIKRIEMFVNQLFASEQINATQVAIEDARVAPGAQKIAQNDLAAMPNLVQCYELTQKGIYRGAFATSNAGVYVGPSSAFSGLSPTERLAKSTSDNKATSMVLQGQKDAGLCSAGVYSPGCNGQAGAFAGVKGENGVTWMDGSVNRGAGGVPGHMAHGSPTMSSAEYNAVLVNIGNNAYYDPPKPLSAAQMNLDPGYTVKADTVAQRLNNTTVSATRWARMERESAINPKTASAVNWAKSRPEWEAINPSLVFPEAPSLMELIRFQVTRDFMGVGSAPLDRTGQQLALNNQLMFMLLQEVRDAGRVAADQAVNAWSPITSKDLASRYTEITSGRGSR